MPPKTQNNKTEQTATEKVSKPVSKKAAAKTFAKSFTPGDAEALKEYLLEQILLHTGSPDLPHFIKNHKPLIEEWGISISNFRSYFCPNGNMSLPAFEKVAKGLGLEGRIIRETKHIKTSVYSIVK